MKCKLCKANNLDNVGSHIFTESLIRTAFNQEGHLKRNNKEIIFESSPTHLGLEYIGQSVLPEEIEKLQELTKEKTIPNDKPNPFINRDLVCRSCEKKFGVIESAFIEKVYNKIITKTTTVEKYISFENAWFLSLQFVIINIWRASTSNYDNFKLNRIQEEYLRKYILATSIEDLKSNLAKSKELQSEIEHFHFAIFIFQQNTSNLTENVVLVEDYDNSFLFLLNRFFVVFDFKKLNIQKIHHLISGIVEENLKSILENETKDSIRIGFCTILQKEEVFARICKKQFEQSVTELNNYFKTFYFQTYNKEPNQKSCDKYAKSMYEFIQLNDYTEPSSMYKKVEQIVLTLS